nr:MAG TPA: hypothetical protein [Caudoviricetes sp.]
MREILRSLYGKRTRHLNRKYLGMRPCKTGGLQVRGLTGCTADKQIQSWIKPRAI